MDMETTITTEDGITILAISGPINVNTSTDVEACINKVIEDHKVRLLIDLKGTAFVSSSGLRAFLSISKKMQSQECPLVFCSPSSIVEEVFSISGFGTLVNVKKTKEEALTFLKELS